MNAQHRIDDVIFDIAFASPALERAWAGTLRSLVIDDLLPLADEIFNQYGGDDTVWQIDTLDVDIGDVSAQDFRAEMAVRLRSALERALRAKIGPIPAMGATTAAAAAATAPTATAAAPDDVHDVGNEGQAHQGEQDWRVTSRVRADIDMLHVYLTHGGMPWQVDANSAAAHETLLQRLLQSGADALLDYLRRSPAQAVLLARLTQQFPESQLRQLLQQLTPSHFYRLEHRLADLRRIFQLTAFDSATQSHGMHLAWAGVLAASLAHPDAAPEAGAVIAQLLKQLAVLRAQSYREVLGMMRDAARRSGRSDMTRNASASYSEIAAMLEQLHDASDASDAVLSADAGIDTPSAATATAAAAIAESVEDLEDADAANGPTPADFNLERMRSRLVRALLDGNAGDLYGDWENLLRNYPGLLREAIQHYCPHGEVTERIAAGFPLSLLRDMSALLMPAAAVLMDAVWADAQLLRIIGEAGNEHGRGHGGSAQRQRSQWIAGIGYLLRTAAAAATQAFDGEAFIDAMLTAMAAGDHRLRQRLAQAWAAASDRDDMQTIAPKTAGHTYTALLPVMPENPPIAQASGSMPVVVNGDLSPPLLFEKIRAGQWPLTAAAFSVADLEQMLSRAIGGTSVNTSASASFRQAIAAHAAAVGDRRHYFEQILYALAHEQAVDLEAIAETCGPNATAAAAATTTAKTATTATTATITADTAPADPIDTADNAPDYPASDTLTVLDGERIRDRLAQALLRGDAAAIYAHWGVWMHEHPALLREALQHYGMHNEVLDRIAAGFPESLLQDMTALLAPQAAQAMQPLWIRVGLYEMTNGMTGDAISDISSGTAHRSNWSEWKRLLWKTGLRHLLQARQAGEGTEFFAMDDCIDALLPTLLPALAGVDEARRQQFTAAWKQAQQQIETEARPANDANDTVAATIADILQRYEIAQTQVKKAQVKAQEKTPRVPAAIPLFDEHERTQLQQLFQQLRTQRSRTAHMADMPHMSALTPEALESLIGAVLSVNVHSAAADRHTFMSAIASQSQTAANRRVYFMQVLDALLDDRPVDLEAIAAAAIDGIPQHDDSGQKQVQTQAHTQVKAQAEAQLETNVGTHVEAQTKTPLDLSAAPALQPLFQQLHEQRSRMDSLTPDALESLIGVFLSADARSPAADRHALMRAVATQAQAVADRRAYFVQVLDALLDDRPIDLEAIAAAVGKTALERAEPEQHGTEHPANDAHAGQGMPDVQQASDETYATYLLSADFSAGAGPISGPASGLAAWLPLALKRHSTVLREALPVLLRNAAAVQHLLALLMPSFWPQILALAPHSQAPQAQRCAEDATDIFAALHPDILPAQLARWKWQFMLHALFAPGAHFAPPSFVRELIGYLAQQAETPVSEHLAALLHRRMGLTLSTAENRTQHTNQPPFGAAAAGKRAEPPRPTAAADTVGDIHVANAGQVLAAPYLPRLWTMLELTHEGAFKSPQAAQRAVHLLQFMLNEQSAAPEYQLGLNKILCGVRSDVPIVRGIDITGHEIDVIEQLIKAMIAHWKIIGNTSVQGLRESFLQRPGWLHLKDDAWHLRIQEGSFDMLLDQLPWSFSIIRYPWMERAVHVNWR
jgi:hypothetical protein